MTKQNDTTTTAPLTKKQQTKRDRGEAARQRTIDRTPDWTDDIKRSVARRIEAMIATGTTRDAQIVVNCGATLASLTRYRASRDPLVLEKDKTMAAWNKSLRGAGLSNHR